jgi:SAM-dependent methyltransferase
MDSGATTIDAGEVERFSRMAADWWNPTGKFKPLHKFNPVRLQLHPPDGDRHFGLDASSAKPFKGPAFLDIGCGGGLLSEPMARLGAEVVGADASETNIEIAKIHAEQSGLDIDYRATTSEALEAAGETFDVVLNMEVVEHVADVEMFMKSCCGDGETRRADVRRHHQPDAESLRNGDHRRRTCAALAAEGHASVREAGDGRRNWRSALAGTGMATSMQALRRQLQSARRRVAAVARHGRQLHGGRGTRQEGQAPDRSVQVFGQVGKRQDIDALVEQAGYLVGRRLAVNAAGVGFAVVDLACFFREAFADILAGLLHHAGHFVPAWPSLRAGRRFRSRRQPPRARGLSRR